MKKLCIIVLLAFGASCNNCPNEDVSVEYILGQTVIKEKVNELELVLLKTGILQDSISDTLSEFQKLDFITKEINGYRFMTDIYNKSNPKKLIVKKDSFYEGCMFFTAYNRYLPNKLVLDYNNELKEVPLNDTTFEYKYRLKPYKLGVNICKGFMVHGRDTYGFENRFTAIK